MAERQDTQKNPTGVESIPLRQARRAVTQTLHRIDDLTEELAVMRDPRRYRERQIRLEAEKKELESLLQERMNYAKELEARP